MTSARAYETETEGNDRRINQNHKKISCIGSWTYQKDAIDAQLHIQLRVRHHL